MDSQSLPDKYQSRQDFSIRLREAMLKSGRKCSPTTLAIEFNARFSGAPVHMATCRKWLLGEAIPTQEKVVALAQMLGVTADWLRFGTITQTMEKSLPSAYDKHELALLADLARLSNRDQSVVRQLVGAMLRKD